MIRLVLPSCVTLAALVIQPAALAQLTPYDPYADSQEHPAPVAADGTIQWGVFYKSAEIQQAYQRLWNLGACRGTSRAITEPVQRNKLLIDRLPEADFKGTVVAVSGALAGGMIVFRDPAASQLPRATRGPAPSGRCFPAAGHGADAGHDPPARFHRSVDGRESTRTVASPSRSLVLTS